MRIGRHRLLASAIACALVLPMAVAIAVVLHEMDHHLPAGSTFEALEHLEAVVHGHHHDARAEEHRHPAVKSTSALGLRRSIDCSTTPLPEASRLTEAALLRVAPSAPAFISPPSGNACILLL